MCRLLWVAVLAVGLQGVTAFGGYWDTPQLFTPANSDANEGWIAFSQDYLTFYQGSERDGHFANSEPYRAVRPDVNSAWGLLVHIPELSSSLQEAVRWVSADHLEGYMHRHGNPNPIPQIYKITRASTSDPWNPPALVTELNSGGSAGAFTATADGLHAMFSGVQTGGLGNDDIFVTSRPNTSSPWSTPILQTDLSSIYVEGSPNLSTDGLMVFFNSTRPGSTGSDIWMSTRASLSDPFSAPILVDAVNSSANELYPVLSPDGKDLYFSRNGDMWVSHWVPEPTALSLLVLGGLALLRRRL